MTAHFPLKLNAECDLAYTMLIATKGLPFNFGESQAVKDFLNAYKAVIQANLAWSPPTAWTVTKHFLPRALEKVDGLLQPIIDMFPRTGFTIVLDGWSDSGLLPFLSILVASSTGAVHVRLKDCAGAQAKDADFLFKVIKDEVFSKAEFNPKDCMQVCAALVL